LSLIPLILSIGIVPVISFAENMDSPRKQMANGVSVENVVCKLNFTLMIRISGDAACVTPTTAEKLAAAGWGTIEREFTDTGSTGELEEELAIESEITDTGSTEEDEGKDLSVEFSESIALKGN